MLELIISVIISLASLMGGASNTVEQASQPSQQAVCTEDMDCWDAATMGQVRPRLSASEIEAWERVSELGIVSPSDDWALEYVDTVTYEPTLPNGYFGLNSPTSENATHIMHWVYLTHA